MTELTSEAMAATLTLEEQVSLLSGDDFWSLPSVDRLGLGRLRVTDGPNGARGGGSLVGGVRSAAFPVGIAIGASWDPPLAYEIGSALAQEVKDKGAHVLLGPTINLHRGALNGRNFECYSEDPELTGALAVGYVRGLQDHGIAATVKHFVGNESEFERTTISSDIDERTLRELYLAPFERAVREGGVWAVMSSYNRLNGTYTSENPWLLGQVLRDEWGFDGVVMSDWFGSHSTVASIRAGLDLEMPGPSRDRGAKLVAAVRAGEVPVEEVRQSAANVLRLMERTGALHDRRPHEERANERTETRALIRRAGAASAVLLKNEGVLPLAGTPTLAVIGPNAKAARCMGGGSAQLNAHRQVSPWEGLTEAFGEARLTFAQGCTNHRFEPVWRGRLKAEYFTGEELAGDPVHIEEMDEASAFWVGDVAESRVDPKHFSVRITGSFTPAQGGIHRIGVHCAGRAVVRVDGELVCDAWENWTPGRTFFEEGNDEIVGELPLEAGRSHEIEVLFRTAEARHLELAALQVGIGRPLGEAAIEEAARAAAEADAAVLCVGRTAEWDSEGADLPDMRLPGRQDELIRAVAGTARRTVVVLQSGGPVEMPWLEDVDAVLQAWYPGQEAGHSIADVLTGSAEPGGRLPQSFPRRLEDTPPFAGERANYPGRDGHVRYAEGRAIGYRHHGRQGPEALFSFGHGLGYADIRIEGVTVASEPAADGVVRLCARLMNHSVRSGSQVAQVYIQKPGGEMEVEELCAFGRMDLGAGESADLILDVDPRSLRSWTQAGWKPTSGAHRFRVALSAADPGHSLVAHL